MDGTPKERESESNLSPALSSLLLNSQSVHWILRLNLEKAGMKVKEPLALPAAERCSFGLMPLLLETHCLLPLASLSLQHTHKNILHILSLAIVQSFESEDRLFVRGGTQMDSQIKDEEWLQ